MILDRRYFLIKKGTWCVVFDGDKFVDRRVEEDIYLEEHKIDTARSPINEVYIWDQKGLTWAVEMINVLTVEPLI